MYVTKICALNCRPEFLCIAGLALVNRTYYIEFQRACSYLVQFKSHLDEIFDTL